MLHACICTVFEHHRQRRLDSPPHFCFGRRAIVQSVNHSAPETPLRLLAWDQSSVPLYWFSLYTRTLLILALGKEGIGEAELQEERAKEIDGGEKGRESGEFCLSLSVCLSIDLCLTSTPRPAHTHIFAEALASTAWLVKLNPDHCKAPETNTHPSTHTHTHCTWKSGTFRDF